MNALVKNSRARLEAMQGLAPSPAPASGTVTRGGQDGEVHRRPGQSRGATKSWTGVGKYGVVASLTAGNGTKSIGLRADTDALPIQEENDLPYKSEVAGVAHLCGHDGHTTMLLAAGEYLARTRNFNGTVRLIFQPAEEIMAGGPAMIEDGLFERWPVDAVFGMHNMPGLELGKLHFRDGAMMAAVDNWEIELTARASHGSMPELSIDPVVAGSSLVMALQTIVSRNVSPHNSAVVTVGAFHLRQCRERHRAVGDPAPVDSHDHAGRSRAGARQGAIDHEGAGGEFRLHLRDPGRRSRGGPCERPGGNGKGGGDRARGVRRDGGDVPRTELSGQ